MLVKALDDVHPLTSRGIPNLCQGMLSSNRFLAKIQSSVESLCTFSNKRVSSNSKCFIGGIFKYFFIHSSFKDEAKIVY